MSKVVSESRDTLVQAVPDRGGGSDVGVSSGGPALLDLSWSRKRQVELDLL